MSNVMISQGLVLNNYNLHSAQRVKVALYTNGMAVRSSSPTKSIILSNFVWLKHPSSFWDMVLIFFTVFPVSMTRSRLYLTRN